MKVKEIVEILTVDPQELLEKLANIDVEADLETEIPKEVIKKLSKLYKVEIKPIKAKKPVEKPREVINQEKPEKPVETKIQAKNEEKIEQKEEDVPKQPKPKVKQEVEEVKEEVIESKPSSNNDKEEIELKHVYDKYQEFEGEEKTYSRLKNVKKNKNKNMTNRQANVPQQKQEGEKILYYSEGMSVALVAEALKLGVGEVVKKLVMLGYMYTANDVLDRDIVEILADDAKYQIKDEIKSDITKFEEMDIEDRAEDLLERPAIVTIMGHVDHGKTTLLDTIRHSKVVSSEAGGITQHIGAYQVEKNGKYITFIDTPGHAAFTEMRARGANITDIVILVVAADDGVMPQTKEAIEHAKAAKVPIIVAINKMDKEGANPERIKQELANYDLLAEEWGGSTIFVPISALKGQGVDELLEMILLVAEVQEYKANPNRLGIGSVIEAKLDKGRGPVATLLVKNGTLKVGDPIVVGNTWGKIRAMQDETKRGLMQAGPSKAVEITGLSDVPYAGDNFMVFSDEKTARLVAEARQIRLNNEENKVKANASLASLFNEMYDSSKELNLIIKGDVQGSIEALKNSLEKVNVEGVKIEIVRTGVGAITETDISLAIASNSIIIAFNIRPNAKIVDLASDKGIEIRQYNIIYKLLEDIEAAMKGMLDPVFEEKVIGQLEVRQTYKVSKVGTIAGCYVTNGYIERGSSLRLIRDSIVIYSGKLSSLKRFKEDVKEVKTGFECGVTIENYNDVKVGDVIEAYVMTKVE